MCCSSKKPKSQIPSQVQQSQIQGQSQAQQQQSQQVQENQQVQHQKPEETRAVNLLESKIETPQQQQQKKFEAIIEKQKEKYVQLRDEADNRIQNRRQNDVKKVFLNEQLTSLQFPNKEISGPTFFDDRFYVYKQRGEQFANTLREYSNPNDIFKIRIIKEFPYNAYSYIAYLKDQGQYFVKCWNGIDLKKFQSFLIDLGKKEQQKIEHYKKYHVYQVEVIQHAEQHSTIGNIHIISTLEDHNLYSFAASPQATFEQRLKVASMILQYLDSNQINIRASGYQQFIKNTRFISPANILISKKQDQIEVKISDWQQQLKEFSEIVPLYEQIQSKYVSCTDQSDDQQSYFVKILLLLFFRINLDQKESFGNLEGTDAIARFVPINLIQMDSGFYKSSDFNRYIVSKINQIAQPNQDKYREVWAEIKEKQIQNLSFRNNDQY